MSPANKKPDTQRDEKEHDVRKKPRLHIVYNSPSGKPDMFLEENYAYEVGKDEIIVKKRSGGETTTIPMTSVLKYQVFT